MTVNYLQVVQDFLDDPDKEVLIINGPAGAGKTFLLRQLIDQDILPINTYFTATTNKATHVLEEQLEVKTQTIYSLFNLVPKDNFQTGQTTIKQTSSTMIEDSVIVCDEAYMLIQKVLEFIDKSTYRCKFIFVGDSYQLPPIFHKNSPVEDIEDTSNITLEKIWRTDKPELKDLNAQLRRNVDTLEFDEIYPNGSSVQVVDSYDFLNIMVESFREDPEGTKVVAWTNNKVVAYNSVINLLLHNKRDFTVGERVIVNNPIMGKDHRILFSVDSEVIIQSIERVDNMEWKVIDRVAEFDAYKMRITDGKEVADITVPVNLEDKKNMMKELGKAKDWPAYFYVKNHLADVRLPHACTVHKSQGSTYNTVFVDVSDIMKNTKKYEVARLLYVAVSRPRHRVVLCNDTRGIEEEAEMLEIIGAFKNEGDTDD